MTVAYPLTWPDHIPRAKSREKGKFTASLNTAIDNVQQSLRLFARDSGKAIVGLVISSNVTLGADKPADPGVAVWFSWDGLQVCIPVDRYQTVAANLQAIHHVIEARRTELRHGTLELVRATFMGFKALPPARAAKPWHDVLGVSPTATKAEIETAYRTKAKSAHPDAGGSNADMADLTNARNTGLRAAGGQ